MREAYSDEAVVILRDGREVTLDEFTRWLKARGMPEMDIWAVETVIKGQRAAGLTPIPFGDLRDRVGEES